jgi:hypothetical protein
MYEIKFENLELHKKYYIENNKGKFKHFGYFSGFIIDNNNQNNRYAMFMNIQRIKLNKKSINIKYFIGYRNKKYWKYYVPEKDKIIENYEKNTLNLILKNIINDPSFFYY